ncbi:MAG: ESPR-type extended signal peptide-containing protein [Acidaminococcus sp.]|uniref:ESPR-type extended signal peptide-containing protein n=1 Tax=Acidaminococcus sp. TaxID=1872103 RepID=UPI003F158C25
MNKIYKVIWNKTRGMYMVVSELAKSQSKGSGSVDKRRKLTQSAAALALFFSIVSAGGTAWAANSLTIGTAELKDSAGTEVKVLTVEKGDASTIGTTLDQVATNKQDITSLQSSVEDAKKYTYRKVDAEEKAREAADTEIKEEVAKKANASDVYTKTEVDNELAARDERVTAEAQALQKRDTELNDRITAVKESLQADASVQDGAVVKAGSTIGKNVQDLDTALAKETAARIGADKAQDAVIQQVNQNAANGIATLATAYNNEVATREAADTELNERITNEANAIHETTNKLQSEKANASDVYTKTEVDNELAIRDERITAEAQALQEKDTELNERITAVKESLQADASVQDGTVVKAGSTIGKNVQNLDTALAVETAARIGADKAQDAVIQQVNQNAANGIATLATAYNNEVASREAADNELNERITNEANAIHETTNKLQDDLNTETTAREAADTALDTRITNVKEYLEKQTSDNYVSKADAAVQDGAVVKAANTIGENVTNLDAALAKETAARIGADAAQDKVIEQVNQNMVDGFNTINTNMANGFAALNAADAAEKDARIGADKKLAEAVNSGLSLSDDNVLQKNTTTVADDGTVTTSKTDANEMILNKGKDNQITLNENGIKVGTNSTVVDKDGVYTGGDTYSEAKAAMSSDGSIKGANGKFTVNSATGSVDVNNVINLDGTTGTVNAKGLNINNGNMTVNSDGNIATNGNISAKGTLSAADGKFAVDSNGGVKAADGKIGLNSDGSVKAADGKFTVDTNGAVKAADGKFTVDSNGAINAAGGKFAVDSNGGVTAANGKASIDSNGKITSTGLDAGSGTIQTTGTVKAGTVEAGTVNTGDLNVTGKATVKDLDVTGEFNAKTLNSKVDANNYTTITGGNVTSKNFKMSDDGEIQASSSTFNEKGSTVWARDDESKGTSTVTADSVKQSLSDVGDNVKNYASRELHQNTDNKYEITDSVVEDKNSNVTNKTAAQSESTISDGTDTNKSTFRQKIDQILQEIKSGNGSTTVTQTDVDITNTAKNGTITNEAQNLVNKASGDMTNTIGGKMLNDVTGDMENKVGGNLVNTIKGDSTTTVTGKVTEDYKSDLSTKVGGNETHAVTGNQTNTVSGNKLETVKGSVTEKYGSQSTTVNGDQSTHVGGNQENVVTGNQTNTISGSKTETVKGDVTEKYGSLTTEVKGDSKLSADNISNTATKKLSNKAADIENSASSSILNKVGDNVSSKMEADKITTVVKDGSKSNTVTDTASTSERKLVSGNIIDILNDAENGYVNTTVQSSDGSSSTGVKQTTTDITNTAKQGSITNEAKNLVNKATEKLSNSAAEIENNATTSIKDIVGKSTVTTTDSGTTFENTDHAAAIKDGSITKTTISGNTVETGQVTTDYATVNKDLTVNGDSYLNGNATVDKDLEVKGNTKLDGTLEVAGKSTFKDDVTMEKNLDVKGTTTTDKLVVNNGATIKGGATTDTLHVTSTSTFDGMATFKDAVSMEKDLSVGGNATVAGDVSAKSYKVADKTYIDQNGINANSQKVTNVADGDVSEGSTDAVNGGQLHATNQRVSTVENRMDGVENRVDRVENRVNNLDNRIDKVGASAAAMANLHPMDFDEDSKVSVAAAVGTYRSETAGALGVFYRPTDRVMMNVSTSFGNGENMVGGGVSFKLGKSSKRLQQAEATNAALSKQVANLQNRLDALLGVLNPNLSKAFPDVPANHWAYEAVSRLAGNDIVQGYEDGKYHGERTMSRYEMAEIIYNALSKGAKAEAKLVEEFRPELQAMAAQRKA